MRQIGLDGGSVLWELGFPSDVVAFFECIKRYASKRSSEQGYELLTDRLFRRYLRFEDLDAATEFMALVRRDFADVPSSDVDWASLGIDPEKTQLDLRQVTLSDVFGRFFVGFSNCVESAKSFVEDWKTYQPVRIVIADQPWFTAEKHRALEEYDALRGAPFWLR
jgi:hypothetical protein